MFTEFLHSAFFPTTVILVDDDETFLKYLQLKLNLHFHCLTFDSPKAAIKFIEENHRPNRLATVYLDQEEMSKAEHKMLSINVRALHREIYNPNRFNDITILISDYAMPSMNGIKLCESINPDIKKILLTGEADASTAIKAFNQKIIHQYIRKDEEIFLDDLTVAIKKLQKKHFQEQTVFLSKSLAKSKISPTTCLMDNKFIEYFSKLCEENNIKEFYITDSRGCFLLLDKNANPIWLASCTKDMLNDFADFAEEDDASVELVKAMRSAKEQPFFFSDEDYKIRPSKWGPLMQKNTEITGELQHYYVSVIKDNNLYKVDNGKIKSYQQFLLV